MYTIILQNYKIYSLCQAKNVIFFQLAGLPHCDSPTSVITIMHRKRAVLSDSP